MERFVTEATGARRDLNASRNFDRSWYADKENEMGTYPKSPAGTNKFIGSWSATNQRSLWEVSLEDQGCAQRVPSTKPPLPGVQATSRWSPSHYSRLAEAQATSSNSKLHSPWLGPDRTPSQATDVSRALRCESRSPAGIISRSTTPVLSTKSRGAAAEASGQEEFANMSSTVYRPVVPPLPWSSPELENSEFSAFTSQRVRPPLAECCGLLNQHPDPSNAGQDSDKTVAHCSEKGLDEVVSLKPWNAESNASPPRGRQLQRRSKSPNGRSVSLRAFMRCSSKSPERQVS